MKKIVLISLVYILSVTAFAQTSATINNPNITIQFKRCIVVSNTAYLDFLIINNLGYDFSMHAYCQNFDNHEDSIAYDDEGNSYRVNAKKGLVACTLGSVTHLMTSLNGRSETIPNGIPIKGRLEIGGVDSYATVFPLVKLQVSTSLEPYNRHFRTIEFRNVPITRE